MFWQTHGFSERLMDECEVDADDVLPRGMNLVFEWDEMNLGHL